jgi:uncharacterized protein YyaL (SSP411 family)
VPNRLADATSPYLRQHMGNPVDWQEWGPEAFAEAARRDVPVLLSVGYAACHWCHVMAHESFEDEAVAAYLNERFVAVKVDREERPDVDAVYMAATQALTGQGGWPMTVFLTPQREPFYAGTYFPPQPRPGMPSFRQLLQAIHEAWVGDRGSVTSAAGRITAALREQTARTHQGGGTLDPARVRAGLDAAVDALAGSYDTKRGGFGGAPKFPPAMVLEFLLRHHARTGDARSLTMVRGTCAAMAAGGIYDQLAGGFARYSVDADWVVPHFEKMLYDNALLLRTYLHLWRATGDRTAERVVRETAQFLLADLRTAEGGFASSLDADSEGHEGRAYVWTPAQLADALGAADAAWAAQLLGVTAGGTFESGASVLQLRTPPEDPDRWAQVRQRLTAHRAGRVQPARDDKVVAAWNGLASAALAEAGALFGQPQWVGAALEAAQLLADTHIGPQGRLRRVSRDGVPGQPDAVLEDYGSLAEAFLVLHSVTGGPVWLERAGSLLDTVLRHFRDPHSGAFFDTADDAEALVVRPQDPTDNVTPSGRSAAAGALLGYAALTGSAAHRQAAESALTGVVPSAYPRFTGWALAVAEAWLDGPREVAVVGPPGDPRTRALQRTALLATAAGAVVSAGAPDTPGVPLLAGRTLVQGAPAAYVCRQFTCEAPVTTVGALARGVQADSGLTAVPPTTNAGGIMR